MKISSSLKVGILALIALTIFFITILWVKGRSFSSAERIEIQFKDVNGMRPGSGVQMMGYRVGQVEEITPVIDGIKALVKEEKPVLGICNGAQILGEIGLVPGIFITNENPKFNCEWVDLKVSNTRTPFTKDFKKGQTVKIPIAHAEGRFYTEDIDLLKDQDQIVLQFKDRNPNGSMEAITSVCDESGLVCAMMPHPERACEEILGSTDGLNFFKGFL